jgi:mannose-1-phosphate guanylyltransferase/mannose-6-phosphate isomerase
MAPRDGTQRGIAPAIDASAPAGPTGPASAPAPIDAADAAVIADASPEGVVHRPWGTYQALHNGDRVQVKLIIVIPGAKLSLQMHHHRAEHWVVARGTAIATRGEEEILLHENQSIYIPLGTRHRLSNPGKIPLHVIEVQSGGYLGEDDIVRFEDTYGRADPV